MAKTKHPPLIADIEPNIALCNVIAIERERSLSVSVPEPAPRSFHAHIRQVLGRLVTALLPRGRPKIAEAHCRSAQDRFRPR